MKKYLLISAIFILALFLRFYNLSTFRCLNWDEAAFGYNAYSILLTGKDEYGTSFPLQFKSVGDYKAPLYVYLTVPVVKILGLNEFAVRFPSALLGSLAVVVLFLLTKELFKNRNLALIAALMLAISPWQIQFTRAGPDFGIVTFFTVLGIYGFIKGTKGSRWGYVLTAIGFALGIYSYYTARLFVPLISIFLFVYYKREVIKTKKNFIYGILVGVLLLLPLIPSFISGGSQEKIFKTTIIGFQRSAAYVAQIKAEDKSPVWYFLFHTSVFEGAWGSVNHYLNHFSPTFLFFEGAFPDPRQFIYHMGVLYLFDLPLILAGIYSLLRNKDKVKYLLIGWLLIAPIPAALTRDQVSARRSLDAVYPLMIISAYGLTNIWNEVKKLSKFWRLISISVFGLSVSFCFGFYIFSYYVLTPPLGYAGPAGWQCGYKELVSAVQKFKRPGKNIIVDTTYQGPYIFFLFYEKYNPASYQKQAKLVQDSPDSLGEGAGYDQYIFRPVFWPDDRGLPDTIFAAPPARFPESDLKRDKAILLDKIYFPDRSTAFEIVKTALTPIGK